MQLESKKQQEKFWFSYMVTKWHKVEGRDAFKLGDALGPNRWAKVKKRKSGGYKARVTRCTGARFGEEISQIFKHQFRARLWVCNNIDLAWLVCSVNWAWRELVLRVLVPELKTRLNAHGNHFEVVHTLDSGPAADVGMRTLYVNSRWEDSGFTLRCEISPDADAALMGVLAVTCKMDVIQTSRHNDMDAVSQRSNDAVLTIGGVLGNVHGFLQEAGCEQVSIS